MKSFNRTRILQGINTELRMGTRDALVDDQARKLVDMSALLVTRMVATAKVEADTRETFMAALDEALLTLQQVIDDPRIAMLARELALRGRLRQWDAVEQTLGPALQALMASTSSHATQAARNVLALDFARRERIEQAAKQEAENARKPVRSGHETFSDADIAHLNAALRATFPDNPEVTVADTRIIAGGFSKQTAFLTLAGQTTLPERVVMRRDRVNSALATTVVKEYDLLKTLHAAGVATAEPLGLYVPQGQAENPFLISAVAAGRNIGDYWEVAEPSESFGLDLARQLARIHKLSPDLFPQIDGAGTPTREHVKAELDATHADWLSLNLVEPVAEAAFAWLYRNLDSADGRRTLVHRDVGCHNMLVDQGRITAIVDWEIAWIGNPARDVAYVKDMVSQCIGWDAFVAEYISEGGVMPGAAELQFYSVWSEVKNLVWTAYSGQIFFSGLSDDLTLGYSGVYNHDRLCHRLARKLSTGE